MSKAPIFVALFLLPLNIAFAAVDVPADVDATDATRCGINVRHENGSVVLEGVVASETPISGSYNMRISGKGGGGSAELVQSGAFEVDSGSSALLGVVSLSPGRYLVTLTIEWDGGATECSEHVAGNSKTLKREL